MGRFSFAESLEAGALIEKARCRNLLNSPKRPDLEIVTQLYSKLAALEDRLLAGRLYAGSIGAAYIPLAGVRCEEQALASISREAACKLQCIPLYEFDSTLVIACMQPESNEILAQLQLATGRPVRLVFAFPQEVDASIRRHYGQEQQPA